MLSLNRFPPYIELIFSFLDNRNEITLHLIRNNSESYYLMKIDIRSNNFSNQVRYRFLHSLEKPHPDHYETSASREIITRACGITRRKRASDSFVPRVEDICRPCAVELEARHKAET